MSRRVKWYDLPNSEWTAWTWVKYLADNGFWTIFGPVRNLRNRVQGWAADLKARQP